MGSGCSRIPFRRPVSSDSGCHFCKMYKSVKSIEFTCICSDTPQYFALAAQNIDQGELYAAAFALALGIGVQNFPEGAAVSLPLRQEGMSAKKAFLYGVLSAAVEPMFGMMVVLVSGFIRPAMPWLLSFAAGAMIYVVVEELIPEANDSGRSHRGTIGSMAGFLIMMILDVALSL